MKRLILFLAFSIISLAIIIFGAFQYQAKIDNIAEQALSNAVEKEEEEEPWVLDNEKVYVYSFNGEIHVYVKGSKKESDKYIGYHIKHSSKELDVNSESSNYDVWNLNGASEYQRNSETNFMLTNRVVTTGEWEMALLEKGANDYVGGLLHGDEVTTDIKVEVDGDKINLDKKFETDANNVTIATTSEIFRDNTTTESPEKIGNHRKTYNFSADGLTIEQEVEFEESLTLNKSYLSMLPILRKSNGESGRVVTDTLKIDDELFDVSEDGFDTSVIDKTNTDKIEIYSEESGFSATMEVLEKSPDDLPSTSRILNNPEYNKVYLGFNPNSYDVSEGDVWKQATKYQIDTTN